MALRSVASHTKFVAAQPGGLVRRSLAKASGAALGVTKSAVQMHGAIGFTDEHEIGRFLKRAMALSARHGNEAAHRAQYAGLMQ